MKLISLPPTIERLSSSSLVLLSVLSSDPDSQLSSSNRRNGSGGNFDCLIMICSDRHLMVEDEDPSSESKSLLCGTDIFPVHEDIYRVSEKFLMLVIIFLIHDWNLEGGFCLLNIASF